jgi:hypothetical protein
MPHTISPLSSRSHYVDLKTTASIVIVAIATLWTPLAKWNSARIRCLRSTGQSTYSSTRLQAGGTVSALSILYVTWAQLNRLSDMNRLTVDKRSTCPLETTNGTNRTYTRLVALLLDRFSTASAHLCGDVKRVHPHRRPAILSDDPSSETSAEP